MKKWNLVFVMLLAASLLMTGCGGAASSPETKAPEQVVIETNPAPETEAVATDPIVAETEAATIISPLPDTTMENLRDGILAISLEEGGAYADETGKLHLELTIYSFDQYDVVDIAMMKVGDIFATYAGTEEITALETYDNGMIAINGGLYEDGFDLMTDDSGLYFECGYNDAKNWYQVGTATLPVSADFVYRDTSDLEAGEKVYSGEDFLNGEVGEFYFTPYDTTIRVENGQIVEMNRMYTP